MAWNGPIRASSCRRRIGTGRFARRARRRGLEAAPAAVRGRRWALSDPDRAPGADRCEDLGPTIPRSDRSGRDGGATAMAGPVGLLLHGFGPRLVRHAESEGAAGGHRKRCANRDRAPRGAPRRRQVSRLSAASPLRLHPTPPSGTHPRKPPPPSPPADQAPRLHLLDTTLRSRPW